MQLESQVGSAAESLASRDIGSNTPENLVDKVDLLIAKFEKFGTPTNNIYVNQYDPQHNNNCSKCSNDGSNKKKAENHQAQEHGSSDLPNVDALDQHQDEELTCILCSEVFRCQDDLKQHCELKHESETYFCKFCGDSFTTNNNLNTHIEAEHTPRETPQTL